MEKHIHTLFNDGILNEASSKYKMELGSLRKVGGFENYVYGYTLEGKEYILRITHSSHRSSEMVQSELDWVEYLSKNNANVCIPIYSLHNNLVEIIPVSHDNYFIATAFSKAPGRHMVKDDATEPLFKQWGKSIGKMHCLTKSYVQKDGIMNRPIWYDDPIFYNANEYLPFDHKIVADKLYELVDKLKELPKEKDGYGLIHTDIHSGNFFIDGGNITVFDFDDCSYQYFISDIAIALFYCLLSPDTTEHRLAFADRFLTAFLEGYREENQLDNKWLLLLPEFLKLRELELYVVIYRSCDMNNPGPWEQNYMNNRKTNIENDLPFLGDTLDLTKYMTK